MIDNFIEERWREFYLPYTFGELHSQRKKNEDSPVGNRLESQLLPEEDNNTGVCLFNGANHADTLDNPLEEELYIQQYPKGHKHKYTTEEI